jgi:hypothetical protein
VCPGAEAIRGLTKYWIKFVDEGQCAEQLTSILSEPLHHGRLTQLYRQFLIMSFKDPGTTVLKGFTNATGTIILTKIPSRRQDTMHLLDMKPVALDHICQGLRSVLDAGDLLCFTHQSFRVFNILMDTEECHPSFLFHNHAIAHSPAQISVGDEERTEIQHMQAGNIPYHTR